MSKRVDTDPAGKSNWSSARLKDSDSLSEVHIATFQSLLLDWYEKNQRRYPWRVKTDPYKILVAEIMLQQTNADKVEPVYTEFVKKYPDVDALVHSNPQDLKALLRPLGLDYRVVRLKNIAERLLGEHGDEVPSTENALRSLPGIGRYVASAVLCFAYSKRLALVDVNVIRLYGRVFGFQSQKNRPRDDSQVWQFATGMLPEADFREYNLALFDFTARICTLKRPNCAKCPVTGICLLYAKSAQTNED